MNEFTLFKFDARQFNLLSIYNENTGIKGLIYIYNCSYIDIYHFIFGLLVFQRVKGKYCILQLLFGLIWLDYNYKTKKMYLRLFKQKINIFLFKYNFKKLIWR